MGTLLRKRPTNPAKQGLRSTKLPEYHVDDSVETDSNIASALPTKKSGCVFMSS